MFNSKFYLDITQLTIIMSQSSSNDFEAFKSKMYTTKQGKFLLKKFKKQLKNKISSGPSTKVDSKIYREKMIKIKSCVPDSLNCNWRGPT